MCTANVRASLDIKQSAAKILIKVAHWANQGERIDSYPVVHEKLGWDSCVDVLHPGEAPRL